MAFEGTLGRDGTTFSFSSSYSSSCRRTYDLFLSYRGSDSNNFRGHLINYLNQKGLIIFKDDEHERGQFLSSALDFSIECSRASIVVFSEEYADSRWCLSELVKILECKELYDQLVRPIFYKVDPSTVRNQRGRYGEAMAAHESRFNDDLEKVQSWRRALREAADLTGWTFTDGGDEPKFIQKVVEEISRELAVREHLYVAERPVGLKLRVQELNSILHIENNENHVRLVVVYGPQGIGKTTLAKAVYNSNAIDFEGSSFLADIRENSKQPFGLVQLQTILLSETLRESNLDIGNVYKGVTLIKKRLRNKKVLLVLDDVGSSNAFHYLAKKSNWFGKGSRIIVTTRDVNLINFLAFPLISTYEVKGLDDHDASKLFHWNAFANETIKNDFVPLTELALQYAQGYPSRLIELGTSLRGKNKDEWSIELKRHGRNVSPGFNFANIFQIVSKITKRGSSSSNPPVDLRFSGVAKHNQAYSINIKGKSLEEKLYERRIYELYFVFRFEGPVSIFEERDIQFIVNPGGSEGGEEHALFLKPSKDAHRLYEKREDGCMEINMGEFFIEKKEGCIKIIKGEFFNNDGDDGEIMCHLMELQILVKKTDIIVEGYEFRLEHDYDEEGVSLNKYGKACVMLSGKKLSIQWTENYRCWEWTSIRREFRYHLVPKLNRIHYFNIEGSVESKLLSSETTYLIYFVFKFNGWVSGFKERPVKFTIKYEKAKQNIEHYAFLDPPEKAAQLCRERKDGWIEIMMGDVFIHGDDNGVVSFSLKEDDTSIEKSGIVVKGIEFRPK